MMTCVLDGSVISDQEALHEIFVEQLQLPEWYGKNLDALYDCLTDIKEETEILLFHKEKFLKRLGAYGKRVLRVLEDASEENEKIKWEIKE